MARVSGISLHGMLTVCVGAVLVLGGCVHITAPVYEPAPDNVSLALSAKGLGPFTVEPFTGDDPDLADWGCRDGTARLHPPGNKGFREYIRDALISELSAAKAHQPTGGVPIRVHITNLRENSSSLLRMVGSDLWVIEGRIGVGDQPPEQIRIDHRYRASFGWLHGCKDTAAEFANAVQAFNRAVIERLP